MNSSSNDVAQADQPQSQEPDDQQQKPGESANVAPKENKENAEPVKD